MIEYVSQLMVFFILHQQHNYYISYNLQIKFDFFHYLVFGFMQ